MMILLEVLSRANAHFFYVKTNKSYGRIESRKCSVISNFLFSKLDKNSFYKDDFFLCFNFR
ncbi:hypothetical protein IT2_330023 [Flavobacterium psychrophilum]|nr:hypothetical protein IT2_330023 [Flavobacterium psychrophilum]